MDQSYCDALQFAIDYERQGEESYRESAKKTGDHFAKKTLTFLADEEVQHIKKITEFNKSLLGISEFDLETECVLSLPERVQKFIKTVRDSGKAKTEPNLSDLAVYSLAMTTEKQGFEMYASVRDSTSDKRLKRFFGFLADEETIHYKLLAESKKYLEDPSYYFEEDGGWIFG